jgi:hypothetical protein
LIAELRCEVEASVRVKHELSARLHRIRDAARSMVGSPTWEMHKAGELIDRLALGYHVKKVQFDMSEYMLMRQEIGRGVRPSGTPTNLSVEGCSRREAEEFINAPTG